MPDLPLLGWRDLRGPGLVPCEHRCEVPEGVRLVAIPKTRHAWSGIINCPLDCGRAFEIHECRAAEPALVAGTDG